MDILLELAKAFLQIGVFSFGGGYAIVALIPVRGGEPVRVAYGFGVPGCACHIQITPGPLP